MIRIDTPADLAETLGLLRHLTGLTQTAVGDELGTNASRIGDYERGILTANGKTLIRHLAALGHQLAIVPLIETAPLDGPSAAEAAETPSTGVHGRPEGAETLSGGVA